MGGPDANTTYASQIRPTFRVLTPNYCEDNIVEKCEEQETERAQRAFVCTFPRGGRRTGELTTTHPADEHCATARGTDGERTQSDGVKIVVVEETIIPPRVVSGKCCRTRRPSIAIQLILGP